MSDISTESYLESIFASTPVELPPHTQHIAGVEVVWEEIDPGVAKIIASGDNAEMRHIAEQVVKIQLERFGYERAELYIEPVDNVKTAHWTDLMAKAKRLIQAGQVTVLRNGYNNIVGHVIGDHGEYTTEIAREDPNSRAITQWQCFLAGTPVTMADGTRKPIEQIVPGDLVVTHLGNIKRVKAAWSKPYEGELTRVRLRGMNEEIVATSNHSMWAANEDFHLERCSGWRGRGRISGTGVLAPLAPTVAWREIGTLKSGDYLSMTPIKAESHDAVNGIKITTDVAYLLGWYTAEGYTISSHSNRIGFSLHWDEWGIAEELSRIAEDTFGTPGTIRKAFGKDRHWMTDFRISSKPLRQLVVELIGSGSGEKKLDSRVMTWPKEVQQAFIDGWFAGDGSLDGSRKNLHTVSPHLAHQARIILARLGFDSNLSWNDNNDGNGFVQNWRRIYRVRWIENRKRADAERFIKHGSVWHRIESISKDYYDGLVYDIEVEDDHSFQAFSVNVHNCECPWDQYAWQRTRQWKKYEGRPCSHVLALYWKSLATPLDETPQGYSPTPGQRGPSGPMEQGPAGTMIPSQPIPVGAPGMAQPDAGVLPQSPMDMLQQMQQPVQPGTTPGGMTAPPGAVSVPGARQPSPQNPIQFGNTLSKVAAEQFMNGDRVRLNQNTYALTEGRDGATDAGRYINIPQNTMGEVLGQDPTTGWVEVIFPLKGGKMTSYHARAFLEPSEITKMDGSTPFIKRLPE